MTSVNLSRERGMYNQAPTQRTQALRRDLARLREQMSTGKRVNRPSDDPSAFSQARRMETLSERYAKYEDGIATAQSWTSRMQDVLNRMTDLYATAREKGVHANNEALSDDNRDAIASQLENFKEKAIDLLNAKHGDEYLFAGNRTNTQPFQADGSVNGAYADINGERKRSIGPNQQLAVNVTGEAVHDTGEGYTIIEAFDELITAVRSGDTSDRQTALDQIETARDHLADLGAQAGNAAQRLTAAQDQLQNATVEVERRQSQAEDADLLKLTTDLQQTQTSLQAALKATASIQQTSLLDYLR